MSNLVTYALIQNLSTLKEALDITTPDHDAKLNGYINRATDVIESYCNRRFLSTVYSNEVYSGGGTSYLILRNFPVTTLSQVQVRQGDFNNSNWFTIDSSLYTLKSEGGLDAGVIYLVGDNRNFPLVGGFHKGIDNVRVTYTAGYAANAIPGDLQEACIELVSWYFNRRRATPGMKSESLGKYSYTLETPMGAASGQSVSIIKRLGLDDILDGYRTIPIVV